MILRLNRYPDLFGLIPWLMLVCLLRNVEGGFFFIISNPIVRACISSEPLQKKPV